MSVYEREDRIEDFWRETEDRGRVHHSVHPRRFPVIASCLVLFGSRPCYVLFSIDSADVIDTCHHAMAETTEL